MATNERGYSVRDKGRARIEAGCTNAIKYLLKSGSLEEAVKRVVERGYGVPDVGARSGISAHSIYKWVKAVSPDKSEQQSKDLLEAKSEILRLR